MKKKLILASMFVACSNTAFAEECYYNFEDRNVVIQEEWSGKPMYTFYFNGETITQTEFDNIVDNDRVYRIGEEKLSGDNYVEYEVCVSPREA